MRLDAYIQPNHRRFKLTFIRGGKFYYFVVVIRTRGSQQHRGCAAINIRVQSLQVKKKKKREFRNSICHRHAAAATANRTNADRTHVSFSNIPFIIYLLYLREIGCCCCWPLLMYTHSDRARASTAFWHSIRPDQTQSPVSPPPTHIYIIIARKS